MVSYKDNFKITKFACYLASMYKSKMIIYMGREHDYLGVIYKFENKKVEVSMFDFLDRTIDKFLEVITKTAATPVHGNSTYSHQDRESMGTVISDVLQGEVRWQGEGKIVCGRFPSMGIHCKGGCCVDHCVHGSNIYHRSNQRM